jgi:hypothetical protein
MHVLASDFCEQHAPAVVAQQFRDRTACQCRDDARLVYEKWRHHL